MSLSKRVMKNGVPLSVESIRRRVLNVIQSVERETTSFNDRYATNIGTSNNWPNYIETACVRTEHKTPYSAMTDYKDLDVLIHRVKGNSELTKFHEYDELRRMTERGRLFDYIAFSLRNDLVAVFENHLERYCLSFYEQANGENLKAVGSYEETIVECRRQGREKLEKVDKILDKVDAYKKSLPLYINKYSKIVAKMEKVCKLMVEACEPLKRWVSADAKYPRRLQEEISRFNKRKMDLAEIVKLLDNEKDKNQQKVKKAMNKLTKIESQLREAKDERAYFRRREMDVQQTYLKTQAELGRKQKDLAEVRSKIKSRQENSPAVYNYLIGMTEAIRSECRALDAKLSHMDQQIESLRKDQAVVKRNIDLLNDDLDIARQGHSTALQRLSEHEEKIRLVREDIDRQQQRVGLLKEIREVKLHSDTVKKLYHHGYSPDKILEHQDKMRTAIQTTAQDIGKDWVWLYQQLPFDPPKEYRDRERDIEQIDMTHWRLDSGYRMLATKALEKWYRQSSDASVEELIQTLKKMKRHKLVDKIYRKMESGSAITHRSQGSRIQLSERRPTVP